MTRVTVLARLDRAEAALRPCAERGDLRAIATMLEIIGRRAVLYGCATTGGRRPHGRQ